MNPAPNTTDQKMNIGKNSNQNIGGVDYWHMNHVGIPATIVETPFPPSNPNTGQARFYFTNHPVEELVFYVARIDHNAGVSNGATLGGENGNDDYYFWMNPNLDETPADEDATGKYVASDIVALANGLGVNPFTTSAGGVGGELSFQRIRLFARANDTQLVFDEFRVGETFADVAPFVSAGTPGDYNGNDKVDNGDYTWRNHLGETFQLDNEGSGITPGMVAPEDFDFWKLHFGEPGVGAGGVGASGVPEPCTLVLLALGAGGCLVWTRRRGRDR